MSGSPASTRQRRVAVLALLIVAGSGGADARGQSTRQQLKPYCKIDYLRLCGGTDVSRAGAVTCFRENIAQVSVRCRRAIARNTKYRPDELIRDMAKQ